MTDETQIMAVALDPLDAMKVASGQHDLLMENEIVRVLDTRLPAGGRTPIHAHEWPGVIYVLSWSDFIHYDPDGNILVDTRESASTPAVGSAIWIDALPAHFLENVGDTELRVISVELKPR